MVVLSVIALCLFSDENLVNEIINRALYAPFVEEGVYRVIAMGAFLRVMNKHAAVIFSALLFVALHYVTYGWAATWIPMHLAAGVCMGYVFIWGKSLGLNAAIHGLGNCALLLPTML
jgi:membrane protease YdiL (CAAX protease family)